MVIAVTAEHVHRARRLFDEALAETFDALFAMPDVVEVVSAVAEGDLAIVITGDSLRVVAVEPLNAPEQASAEGPESETHLSLGTGCYL